jgi:hypothetical protein
VDILPDPGENNPFVSGTTQGTYTAYLILGERPAEPPPNTFYTGTLTTVSLSYRIYHATDPESLPGGTTNPVLPDLWLNGQFFSTCPVRPVIVPEDATVWGRLDNGDWFGTPPTPANKLTAYDPPRWNIRDPFSAHFFPNGDNYYFVATLSREFLQPNTSKELVVVRFKAPTSPRTRSGEPVYADRQVRFWSLCTDDPYTTNVHRCIPDDEALLNANGYATFVICDPGSKPSDASLAAFRARWLPWGALALPTDVVYDRRDRPWGIDTPVHYYNTLIYRQTRANPSFAESMANVVKLPRREWKAAMGPYWPASGYCSKADFETYGAGCLQR